MHFITALTLAFASAFFVSPAMLAQTRSQTRVFNHYKNGQQTPYHTLLLFAPSRTHPLMIRQKALFHDHPSLVAIQIAAIVEVIGSGQAHITGQPPLSPEQLKAAQLREKFKVEDGRFTLIWLNSAGEMVEKRHRPLQKEELL